MDNRSEHSLQYIWESREAIGKQLRAFREKKGLSQDELAGVMGVHRSTIAKAEAGKFAVTIDYLAKFAWHLGFQVCLLEEQDE